MQISLGLVEHFEDRYIGCPATGSAGVGMDGSMEWEKLCGVERGRSQYRRSSVSPLPHTRVAHGLLGTPLNIIAVARISPGKKLLSIHEICFFVAKFAKRVD